MENLDYQILGREIILESVNHYLNKIENADRVIWNSPYANPYNFEIFLKRIGENKLAERFDGRIYLENIVKRVHCNNTVLTAVIANLEKGNKKRAKRIESCQRKIFYLEGVGYVDPHFRGVMHPLEEKKENLRQSILEKGLSKGQDGSNKVSLVEGIYALYANLALGQNQHASKILDAFFNLYYEKKSGLFNYSAESGLVSILKKEKALADILRGMGIINDQRVKKIYQSSINLLMNGIQEIRETKRFCEVSSLCSTAFCLDYFKERDKLGIVRNLLLDMVPKIKSNRKEDDIYGKEHNKDGIIIVGDEVYDTILCMIGLGVIGLEKDKPNWFYIPAN